MRKTNHITRAALAAAVAAAVGQSARADVAPGGGVAGPVTYNISTTGATAIGRFNSMEANSFIMTLGQNDPLTIGRSTYSLNAGGIAQPLGAFNISGGSTDPLLAHDRLAYYYHQTGSIEGILELADTYGLNAAAALRRPTDATSSNPVWMMSNRVNGVNYNNATNAVDTASQAYNGYLLGRNYRNTGAIDNTFRSAPSTATADQIVTNPAGQDFARIAWSDVRHQQGFARGGAGTGSVTARPDTVGYGQSPGAAKGSTTNFQKFRNESALVTPTNAHGLNNFRSETVAIVPFAVSANPGTGLEIVSKTDGQWLNTTGRLQNGANFNFSTRDVGSGTRNQAANNFGVDPTWAVGERDRRHLGGDTASYSALTTDGAQVTVNVGDEAAPTRAIDGSSNSARLALEHRAGARLRFADKTGGGNLKSTIVGSRMGMGVLSTDNVGADGKTGNGVLANQLRVLRVDSENGFGAKQPKPDEITGGQYTLWSQAQAVTVKANPLVADTDAPDGRAIAGDTIDHAGSVGTHRKFLDNIFNSVGDFPVGPTAVTPADGIINSGFILPQLMTVTKNFDGDAYGSRTRTPQQQSIYDSYKAAATAPGGFLDWAEPSAVPGHSGNVVKYETYAFDNLLASSTTNATKSIVVNDRLALAGDFDDDDVRDLGDVEEMALARVRPDLFVAGADGWAAGSIKNGKNPAGPALADTDGLIVLSDLDGDGNFTNNAGTAYEPVAKKDVRFFLYGAAVDTTDTAGNAALNAAYNSADAAGMTLDRKRRVFGTRIGQLKKNAAIDTYNATLDSLVTAGHISAATAAAEKFNKHDVDNDGLADVYDAVVVDRNDGQNYTNLDHVLFNPDDLIAAELNDNNVIDAADVAVMNAGLGGVGQTHWAGGTLTKTGPHAVVINRTAGAGADVTIAPAGQTLQIDSGRFYAGGTADVFTDTIVPTRHVGIVNNSAGTGVTSDLGFNVTAGAKQIGTLSGTGSTAVSAGASLTTDHVRQAALAVDGTVTIRSNDGPTGVSRVASLHVGAAGKLDLADNDLIVDYDGAASPEAAVRSHVVSGRNTGFGILSTPGSPDDDKVLAVADNATWGKSEFGGQSIDTSTVVGKYTFFGDANLDGKVTGDDYVSVDANLGTGDSWLEGDFNMNGVTTGDDYVAIDANLGKGTPTPLAFAELKAEMVALHVEMFGEEYLAKLAAVEAEGFANFVPEPGAASVLGIAALTMLGRRRRRDSSL